MRFVASGVGGKPTVQFSGVNVQVVSGSGSTAGPVNGEGNLVVGYDESEGKPQTGSHNLVVGPEHSFTSFGGFLAGDGNSVTAAFGSVSGGADELGSRTRGLGQRRDQQHGQHRRRLDQRRRVQHRERLRCLGQRRGAQHRDRRLRIDPGWRKPNRAHGRRTSPVIAAPVATRAIGRGVRIPRSVRASASDAGGHSSGLERP